MEKSMLLQELEEVFQKKIKNLFLYKILCLALIGIGREVLENLHSYGATVYALSLEPMEDLKAYANVVTVSLNLSNWSEARTILTRVFENVKIDGLVNNAGITICKKFEEFTESDYDRYV